MKPLCPTLPAPLCGIVPPLLTPLAGRDTIDVAGLERLIEHTLAGGVDGLFLLGTTGEAVSLTPDSRRELVRLAAGFVAGRAPVLVGVTDNSVAETLAMADYAADAGANAVVATSPFYVPLEQHELVSYIRTLADASTLPVFLYNMPRLTKTWFDVATVERLMEIDSVVGLKDSSGDLEYLAAVCALARKRAGWSVLVGPEDLLVQAVGLGADGCVGGGGNVWPRLLVDLYQAAVAGDGPTVDKLQSRHAELSRVFAYGGYAASAIRGLKCSAELMGLCSGLMAEPFEPCTAPQREAIERVLRGSGLLAAGDRRPHAMSQDAAK
ncbi:putative 2-keto-3-deoxy-galactonate aldolase YagE [Pirellulimonas nuda]|uniref:Putative 2-keto-3-deoxy-galactonate aldolase YagE n=1 Tax=Pirellulimonas nuda TaxID=2528009 RepID=A0A518DHJ1_9BACT|nr:dihydrodipicolinate synthase family protein [Pirellulimonas nuda]QDU90943.1 putative 2-keto-3-deoxy-galactonate aldolase YagE [Pirellulimonas nuda]